VIQHLIHFFMFAVGSMLSTLLRAECSVMSKSNSLSSDRQWFLLNRNMLKVHAVLQFSVLMMWYGAPEVFGEFIRIQLPMTALNCYVMGFAWDNFWHNVGFRYLNLGREIPLEAPPDGR
jgi:hypothetical protein